MRLIDTEAFEYYVNILYCSKCKTIFENCHDTDCWIDKARRTLEALPTIEAKPVVHAHWIVTSNGEDKWVNKCSACGGFLKRGQKQTNFCPNCGAQMPGGSLKNNTQKADVDKHLAERGIIGEWVKIPVISMEDVPKIAKEMNR